MCAHAHTETQQNTMSGTHTHTCTLRHWAGTSLKDWKQLKLSSAVALGRPVAAKGELPLCISLSISATHSDMRGRDATLSKTHCHNAPSQHTHMCAHTGLRRLLMLHLLLRVTALFCGLSTWWGSGAKDSNMEVKFSMWLSWAVTELRCETLWQHCADLAQVGWVWLHVGLSWSTCTQCTSRVK